MMPRTHPPSCRQGLQQTIEEPGFEESQPYCPILFATQHHCWYHHPCVPLLLDILAIPSLDLQFPLFFRPNFFVSFLLLAIKLGRVNLFIIAHLREPIQLVYPEGDLSLAVTLYVR
jgi:hypothetical protein